MSAKDLYHNVVVAALTKAGWKITDDPLTVRYGERSVFIDLGAEREFVGAERDGQRIAVEIKTFLGASDVNNLGEALGQYNLYLSCLRRTEPDRILYLAVPEAAYTEIFSEPIGQAVIEDFDLRLIVYDVTEQEIEAWIPQP